MSKSLKNLQAAFAGESQANRKYLAFAEKADAEGYPQIARMFRAAAEAETVHAHNHFRAMGGLNSTTDNLKAAIQGENYEVETMYPEFVAAAEEEQNKKALGTFKWALEVEKTHEALYKGLQTTLEAGKDFEEFDYYVCPVCGHTHERNAPDKCPVCGIKGSRFVRIG